MEGYVWESCLEKLLAPKQIWLSVLLHTKSPERIVKQDLGTSLVGFSTFKGGA